MMKSNPGVTIVSRHCQIDEGQCYVKVVVAVKHFISRLSGKNSD